MKKKILFLTAAAAMLSFAACNKEKTPGDTDVTGSELNGYVTVKISSPTTRTTPGSEGTDPGIAEESAISTVTVVFTDDNGLIQYIKSPNLMPSSTTTEPFRVEIGTYKMYVLVNNPGSNVIHTGDDIDRIITVATVDEAEEGYLNGTFFMVNARHNSMEEAGVDVTIDSSHTATSPLNAAVSVDRVAVKIEDTTPSPDFAVSGATWLPSNVDNLHVDGFAMLNINRQFNMIQQWGEENTNGVALTPGANVLQTPLYPAGGALVKDQYFRNISEYTTLTKDASGNITAIEDIVKDLGVSPFTTDTKYASENRPTILIHTLQLTAGRGETTGVIFKVVAQSGGSPVGTFFSFRGAFYTNLADIEATDYFAVGELTTLTIPEIRAKGVQVYENGVMYYTHFILDPNTAYTYDSQNYYGVFRNSVYRLNIASFNTIGDDVPGGGIVDPEEPGEPGNPPIDLDEAYIDVEITINPWVLNTIDIDF